MSVKLLGIAGLARSGKDTAARYIAPTQKMHQYSFASPLKDMLTQAFGDHFYTGDRERICPEAGVSYRVLMQTLGTEWGREINPNIWVNLVQKRWDEVKNGQHFPGGSKCGGMLLSDVRFDSEAQWILDNGGVVLHLRRDGLGPVGIAGHASEADISPELITHQVINDSDLPSLYRQLNSFMEEFYGS